MRVSKSSWPVAANANHKVHHLRKQLVPRCCKPTTNCISLVEDLISSAKPKKGPACSCWRKFHNEGRLAPIFAIFARYEIIILLLSLLTVPGSIDAYYGRQAQVSTKPTTIIHQVVAAAAHHGKTSPRRANWPLQQSNQLFQAGQTPVQFKPKSSSSQPFSTRSRPTNQIGRNNSVLSPVLLNIREPRSSAASAEAINNDGNKKQASCALILQRTFVRRSEENEIDATTTLDEPQVEPTGQVERLCITYQHIDRALEMAKLNRQFDEDEPELLDAIQSVEPAPAYIAKLGELNQELTKILAQKFDLSPEEILNGLPLIDMSKTNFWPLCPLMVRPIQCDSAGRFRSFTGHCNNLRNPSWGAAQTPFVRFLAPQHSDGIEMDRVSVLGGEQLPSPRKITSQVHRDMDRRSSHLSLLVMVWGQMIDHDVALAAPPRNELGLDFNCCKQLSGDKHPNCKTIEIPINDPLYSRFGQTCMDFKRSLAGLRPNCALGPRVHINAITATIDANTIYGSTKQVADQLRTFSGGLLKVQDKFKRHGLKPLLPEQIIRPDLDCFDRLGQGGISSGAGGQLKCFLGGDERVNEQPTLTAMHTIYVRDHNRIANQLASLNPHWDDERIYHETRHIEAAIIQHLLVSEYLPILIGPTMMQQYNLTETPPGTHWHGYDSQVTPSISQGFSTAAFRQGHTFIQGLVRLFDPQLHRELGSIPLRQLFKRPFHYYKPHRLDQVLAGIVNTPAQSYDPFITQEISGHLFQEPGEQFGMDLPAINLARGREQGTPGYTAYRHWCNLRRVRHFDDLMPDLFNGTVQLYKRLYKHVDDIDLWSAGVSERPIEGGQVGPTFACIIGRQFANIKRGDRFWFELAGQPSSFTLDQLDEIKKTSQARVLCKNSDNLNRIQSRALELSHPILNPLVPCDQIPDLDLKFWRENPQLPGQFYTEQ